jgi:hypothetical protein
MTRLTVWLVGLTTGLVALYHLPVPSDAQPAAILPAVAAVRLLALGLGSYLVVSILLGLALRVARVGAAVRVANIVTLPSVRALLDRAAGISLAVGITFATPIAAAAARPPSGAAAAPARV